MMDRIQFEYPASYLLLCALLAILYAAFMYANDSRWKEKSNWIPWALGAGRFFLVFILAVLLLSPFLTYFEDKTEKPVLILAHDASESIQMTPDSILNEFKQNHKALSEQFSTFDLHQLAFGEETQDADSLSFSQKKTNIAAFFDYVQRQFAGRNIGAIILASDGLYNVGQNPLYATSGIAAPVYTIPLGDTSARRDISIAEVFHNPIAFLDDQFKIQVDVEASRLNGKQFTVSVSHNQNGQFNRIREQTITIDRSDDFKTLDFTLDAKRAGMNQYRVAVTQAENEISYQNNSQDFFIDIIDSRQKVLILGGAPHPDITAIRQILSENDNYEIELAFSSDRNITLEDFDLLILHQIPFRRTENPLVTKALDSKVPKILITGLATDLNRFNNVQSLVRIKQGNPSPNAIEVSFNPNFNAFIFDEETASELENYPPLETFFGEFDVTGKLNTLFYQQIGEVRTEYPLIAVGEDKGQRIGLILAEGFWRWRLFDFMKDGNHETTSRLLEQLTQYVSLKEDRRRFRVSAAKDLFDENERIRMRAELYNETYELINQPDVQLTVSDEEGNDYTYTFSREDDFYTLDLGFLPAGNYQYTAETRFNGRAFNYSGRFSVETIQLEMYKTVANHNLLQLLAQQNNGSLISPENMLSIRDSLNKRDALTPVYYSQARTQSMINLPWVFWLMAILLTIEWVSRRLAGTY